MLFNTILFTLSLAGLAAAQEPALSPRTQDDSYSHAYEQTPPAPSHEQPSEHDYYEKMPYDAWKSGGYKELSCGYGPFISGLTTWRQGS